jgi:hypothetical protein
VLISSVGDPRSADEAAGCFPRVFTVCSGSCPEHKKARVRAAAARMMKAHDATSRKLAKWARKTPSSSVSMTRFFLAPRVVDLSNWAVAQEWDRRTSMSTCARGLCPSFALSTWLCLVLAMSACGHEPARRIASQDTARATTPATSAAPPPTNWHQRGAAAGTISPRQAGCPAHCKHELDQVQPVPAPEQANTFSQACTGSCLAEIFEKKGMQCYAAFGAASAGEWQALYLMRGIAEALIPCTAEVPDAPAEALRMRSLFEVEQRSPETRAAVAAERRALLSGAPEDTLSAVDARRHANESSAWQAVLQAFQAWQASASQGEGMSACFERRHAVCAIALGAE